MKKLIKPLCLLTGLLCAPAVLLHAQVDEKLKADIVSTGYVHSPLPLDETKAFETFRLEWHCHRLSSFCGCGASHHLVAPLWHCAGP